MDVCCVLGGGGLDKNSLSKMCTVLLFSQGPIIRCVCVWESVSAGRYTHTHTHNAGDTTTVYQPKACYDVVNVESCVGGFVALSAGTGFCQTQ